MADILQVPHRGPTYISGYGTEFSRPDNPVHEIRERG
jgi:hypothetical protein